MTIKTMLAIVDHSEEVVWGIGETVELAWADSRKWLAEWKKRNPDGRGVNALQVATLSPDAELGKDGETLYQWVKPYEPVQESLL